MTITKIGSLLEFILATTPGYIASPLHVYLCEKIEAAVNQGDARLCISIPPRHGKSEIISKALPAYYLSKHPESQIMEICYGSDLAADFGARVRELMNSDLYKWLYPASVPTGEGKAGNKWMTVSGGLYKGVGIGGSITGFGADLMVIDDIVKNRKEAHSPAFKKQVREFFGSTLFSRILPGGSVIILMTRWTADDLVGMVTSELGWEYINLPAICTDIEADPLSRKLGEALFPQFYPVPRLEEIRQSCNEYDWLSLYQGTPPDSAANFNFTHTLPGCTPSEAVWMDDYLGLFRDESCTLLRECLSYEQLLEELSNTPTVKRLYSNRSEPVSFQKLLKGIKVIPQKLLPHYQTTIGVSIPPGQPITAPMIGILRQYEAIKIIENPRKVSNRLSTSSTVTLKQLSQPYGGANLGGVR